MKKKYQAPIACIELNEVPFNNASCQPTLINFFFGKNGAGKSTVARAIADNIGLMWVTEQSAEDHLILVYDEEFRKNNLQNYDNLPGVFTINQQNIDVQNKIDEKTVLLRDQGLQYKQAKEAKGEKERLLGDLLPSFQNEIWNKTAELRTRFEKTQEGRKQKRTFSEAVIAVVNDNHQAESNLDDLENLYQTAFDSNARIYPLFQKPEMPLPESELLGKEIVSSSNTPFAEFMKHLQATDWVRYGHEHFVDNNNSCPYCQQALPYDFEEQITKCFDAAYDENISALKQFADEYSSVANSIISVLRNNLSDAYPKFDTTKYRDKLELLSKVVEVNIRIISDKKSNPGHPVVIADISSSLVELFSIIDEANSQIIAQNTIVNSKQKKQAECKELVWRHIAFCLLDSVFSYLKSKNELDDSIRNFQKTMNELVSSGHSLKKEISDLNRQTINTSEAVDHINLLLRDSGFEGFSLREKKDAPNVYEVVRPDGSVATRLSEGEQNFIAFLYFYEMVKGSSDPNDATKHKIVVIDDPVSSMDSSALFIVSALVRELVEVCHNNVDYRSNNKLGDYIKQIFVLTHNTYFHREITYNQINRFDFVSFNLVEKFDNASTIKHCVRRRDDAPALYENFNPVQNAYSALWSEFKEVKSEIPLVNVVRRILEYYFLQLCGYEGTDLRDRILVKNKEKFVLVDENGKQDTSKFQVASSLLSYITTSEVSVICDGLNYVAGSMGMVLCRDTFRMIFELMGQIQHYDMMMDSK